MKKTAGYLAHVELMQGLANLGMPEDDSEA